MIDPNGPANMIATGVFWTGGIAVLVGIGKAWDRFATRRISKALDNGDTQTLRAVVELDAYRSRVSVPRKLGERTR